MEISQFIFEHAAYAHWVVFLLFMLAGLNVPISEDLLIITSGVIASAIIPENTWKLFACVFFGAYISDFFPYFIGRRFGENLWKIRWFSRMIKRERLEQIKSYYARYGVLTLLIGRFIPFGVRNCLFLSSGLGKMRFWKFAMSDGIACLLSNTTLFSLAFLFGKNYALLMQHLKVVNIAVFIAFACIGILYLLYRWKKTSKRS